MPKSPDSNENKPSHPLWETLAMAASFVLLWFWFSARQSALKANVDLPVQWTFALLISLVTMVVITVIRLKRFKRALDETQEQMRRPPMPFGFTPPQPPQNKPRKK